MRRRYWAVIGGVAALLLLGAGAFAAWGPVGFGDGPLSVAFVSSTGTVPQSAPTMILIPVQTTASARAVIDAVGITGGGGSPPPVLLQVVGVTSQSCSGIWYPLTGHSDFRQRCAPDGTVPVLGHAVPLRPATLLSAGRQDGTPGTRGVTIGIEVSPPGVKGCWGIGKVAVHYHVAGRHYTSVAVESISGCNTSAQLAPDGATTSPPPGTSSPATTGASASPQG